MMQPLNSATGVVLRNKDITATRASVRHGKAIEGAGPEIVAGDVKIIETVHADRPCHINLEGNRATAAMHPHVVAGRIILGDESISQPRRSHRMSAKCRAVLEFAGYANVALSVNY